MIRKLMILTIVLAFSVAVFGANAHGTAAGTSIDSTATVSGGNFGDQTDNTAGTAVLEIEGGVWMVPVDQTGGIAGAQFDIDTALTNYGNKVAAETFTLSVVETADSGAGAGAAWTTDLSNIPDVTDNITTIDISSAAQKGVCLQVAVAGDAPSAIASNTLPAYIVLAIFILRSYFH